MAIKGYDLADILGIYYWHDYYDGNDKKNAYEDVNYWIDFFEANCMEEKAEQIKALLIKQKAFVEEAC